MIIFESNGEPYFDGKLIEASLRIGEFQVEVDGYETIVFTVDAFLEFKEAIDLYNESRKHPRTS